MQQVPDSILEKIQKMQNLADRAGTPGEAAAAMALIQEMLLKYNLDMATVQSYKPIEKEDVIHERHNLNEYQTYHDGDFAYNLITSLARFNFCRTVGERYHKRVQKDQGDFVIIGQRHNVQIVMYMYDYCINNLKIMANEGWKTYDRSDTKIKTVFVRHFFDGAVKAISDRLYNEKVAAEKAHGETMFAMVKFNDKAVGEAVQVLYPRLRTVARKTQRDTNAAGMGYQAGKSLNLAAGLQGGGGYKRLN